MSKITEQDFLEQYDKYNGCQAKLASHYNLSERSIRNYKAKFIKKATISKEELVSDYYVNVKSITEIANKYKVSRDTIYRLLEHYKIPKTSKYDIEKIRKAYTVDNFNISELLVIAGISNRTVLKNLLDKHNIVNPTKQAITELYVAGYSNSDIAMHLGMSENLVEYNLKHHSIYREKQVFITKQDLISLRANKTLEQIAEHYKCSSRTISAYIAKYDLDRKDTTKHTFNLDNVIDLYTVQNLTMDEIADIYGCCRKTINDFIRENGILSTNKENKYERKIREFLECYSIVFEQNNRKLLAPKELDFYIPKANVAIELCGLYWHSTQINKNKLHIKEKHDMCSKAGVRLITIFEDELLYKFDIVINRLKSLLKLNRTHTYARQCTVKEIPSREGIDFLNEHHIQGAGKNFIYLGAYHLDKLVAVMSFSNRNPAKGQTKNTKELNRFANPFNITGIASKLFKFYVKNYNPTSIISYSDNRWNTGNLYTVLGFNKIRTTSYNYWYVVKQERKHRFAFTKQRLLAMYPQEDASQTEEQIAEKYKLYRIYDCGSTVYEWNPL